MHCIMFNEHYLFGSSDARKKYEWGDIVDASEAYVPLKMMSSI